MRRREKKEEEKEKKRKRYLRVESVETWRQRVSDKKEVVAMIYKQSSREREREKEKRRR